MEYGYVTRNAINDGAIGPARFGGLPEWDKLAELLKGATGDTAQPGAENRPEHLGGMLGNLGGALAGGSVGSLLSG
jgi:hypothetical protein